MALSTELRDALASRHRLRLRCRARSLNEQPPENNSDDDPNDDTDPDDCVVQIPTSLPALPPPSPDWSHLLCGRPHEPASVLFACTALLAVGCRLGINPSSNALCEASRCHSVGAVRQLLELIYGEHGLTIAYQLAGREQPPKTVSRVDRVTYGDATAAPLNCDAIEPGLAEAIMQAPSRVQRWMLAPPRESPRWRTSLPSEEVDNGSWCG
jgi:hypothetical protein